MAYYTGLLVQGLYFYPISLSKFFGKLGKNSRRFFGDRIGKLVPVIFAQLITFFVIGIWHGAEFKYIAYGLYQAVFIIGGILFEPYIIRLTGLLGSTQKPLAGGCSRSAGPSCW